MSMLNALATDFDMMLEDWGQQITVKHLTGETLNATSGEITKVENSSNVQAIVKRLAKKDMDKFPSVFSFVDCKCLLKAEDASIEKGDTVTTGGVDYIVHELEELYGIYHCYLKRA